MLIIFNYTRNIIKNLLLFRLLCRISYEFLYSIIYIYILFILLMPVKGFSYPESLLKSGDSEKSELEKELEKELEGYELEEHNNINNQEQSIIAPSNLYNLKIPKNAKKINLFLNEVNLKGVTAFPIKKIKQIYLPYLKKQITLENVYQIAQKITELYRSAGYFISIAYVPEQSIANGIIELKIVEGYIGKITLPKELQDYSIINKYANVLLSKKPVAVKHIENFLLNLNDLPQYNVSSTLSALKGAKDGAARLILKATPQKDKQHISINNMTSKSYGPLEFFWSYTRSLFYPQKLSINTVLSCPKTKQLNNFGLQNVWHVAPNTTWEISSSISKNRPVSSLTSLNITGRNKSFNTSVIYNLCNYREQNVTIKLTFDGQNRSNYSSKKLIMNDKGRTFRLGLVYYTLKSGNSYNIFNMTISKGLKGLGASKKGDLLITNINANPNFNKIELSYARMQKITTNLSMLISSIAQYATASLLSLEQFGYGGQSFGRSFDSYEIKGDHGINGSLEIKYHNLIKHKSFNITPYIYYDIGMVQNHSSTKVLNAGNNRKCGSSMGIGMRGNHEIGISGHIGVAWPLIQGFVDYRYNTKKIGSKFFFQISWEY